jgi:hypothetical protein
MVEVTQADRDFVVTRFCWTGIPLDILKTIRIGKADHHSTVQATAAHRLFAYAPDKVTPEIAQMAARKMYAGIRAPAFDTDGWGELDHARKELLTSSMTAAILAAFAVLRGDDNG